LRLRLAGMTEKGNYVGCILEERFCMHRGCQLQTEN
jgi:hypothetical protein